MGEKVTLYDIASELDISASTVSRVLNGSALISDEKSLLIRETADRMGYVPRTVKKQKNRAILNIHLFLPPSRESFVHLFYDVAQLLDGIKEGFGDVSINISTRVNDGDTSFLSKKKTGAVDGCLFAFTTIPPSLKKQLEKREIPYIHLNRAEEPAYVLYDNEKAMDKLVGALYGKYRKDLRIAYLGYSPLPTVDEERWKGVSNACRRRNILLTDEDRFALEDLSGIGGILDLILERGYNGVIAFNDMVAMALYHQSHKRGLSLPEEFSLTGMDNSPVQLILSDHIDTVAFSVSRLGREAGQWLYSRIIEKSDTPCRLVLEGDYIKGDTL
ncbi:MAG: LacI family DNA-binding transcriptional regulator [Spirochaetales bacterium]|nr:LacI family DNA-binding transcriptional regulator [Spirochaetales bacterium]